MRLIGKLILALLALLLSAFLYSLYTEYNLSTGSDSEEQEKEFYISHNAFKILNGQNLSFSLPKNATNFKILLYPVIDKTLFSEISLKPDVEKNIEFFLDVNYAGSNKKQVYVVDVKSYTHVNTGDSVEPFWLNDEQNVLLSKTLEIEVPNDKEISFSIDSEQASAYLVRSYYQQRQSKTRVRQRWQRASDRRKENLLKYYPFDADTISNAEINSLYKNSWSSVAPTQGASAKLQAVRLFEYENRDELVSASVAQYSNLNTYLPRTNKYTFKLFENASVRLNAESLNSSEELSAVFTHKSDNAIIQSSGYKKPDFNNIELKPGQYELSFSEDVAFNLESDVDESLLEQPLNYRQVYNLDKDERIRYAVKSLPNIQEYYKVAFHAIGELKNARVQINTYSNSDLISSQNQDLAFQASEYMPFINSSEKGLLPISAAIEKNITVSTQATHVEFIALDNAVSLNLSNTVSGLASIKKVSNQASSSYQNSWFLLKPENALEFLRDKKVSRYLYIESNAIRPERVAQSFEKLRPQEIRRFKEVFYQNKSTVYSGNSAVNFRKLQAGREYRLKFNDKKTSKVSIRPTLLVHSGKSASAQIEINFADKALELDNSEPVQEYLLPKVVANRSYTLTVPRLSNKAFYINHTSVGQTLLVKRQFFKAKRVTKYKFYKRQNVFENLSINLLASKKAGFEVKTSLYKNGRLIQPQKTSATRRFIFDNFDEELSKDMLRNSECGIACFLYTPQFLPLYEDLNAGWYELHIETPGDFQVYLDVGKTYYEKGTQSIIFNDELQN